MSRSWKKHPISKDNQGGGARLGKRRAASRIRNFDPDSLESEVLSGKSSRFKKINQDTYDIHDYISRWTEEEARQYWRDINNGVNCHKLWRKSFREQFLIDYPTEDDYINKYWAKCVKRK